MIVKEIPTLPSSVCTGYRGAGIYSRYKVTDSLNDTTDKLEVPDADFGLMEETGVPGGKLAA